MKYIDKVLGRNEEIVHESGLHWIIFVVPCIALLIGLLALRSVDWHGADNSPAPIFIAFVFIGVGLPMLVRSLVDFWTTEIAVTTHRVVFKRGLIARDTIELSLNRIEGLDVKQSVTGRILNFGTVLIRGTGLGLQPMKDIASPIALRNAAFGDFESANRAPVNLR
jgi:uncharacterized membrane protein YdbT with pleckstrin-like domain